MAYISVKQNDKTLFEVQLDSLSPLGFSCQIRPDIISYFQEAKSSRILVLDAELFLDAVGAFVCIQTQIRMIGVRKLSQDKYALDARFEKVEQGAYKYISEYVTTGQVISYAHNVTQMRRA